MTELPCECIDEADVCDDAECAETAETSDFSDSQSDSDSATTFLRLFFFSFLVAAAKSALFTA